MARARLLKPGFFSNEDLAEIGPLGQLLFAGLWTLADKKGRMDDRPKRIKAEVFPYYKADVPALLDKLEELGFIERYAVESAHFIQITNFDKHQHPHKNEPDSVIPSPSENVGAKPDIVRTEPDISGRRPAEAKAEANTESEAEAEAEAEAVDAARPLRVIGFNPLSEPPNILGKAEPEIGPFYLAYVKHYEQAHGGDNPSPNEKAAARKLERDFGTDACMEIAADHEWKRHPNWLREALNDPERARKTVRATGRGAAGATSEDPSGLREWQAFAAGEDQRATTATATRSV